MNLSSTAFSMWRHGEHGIRLLPTPPTERFTKTHGHHCPATYGWKQKHNEKPPTGRRTHRKKILLTDVTDACVSSPGNVIGTNFWKRSVLKGSEARFCVHDKQWNTHAANANRDNETWNGCLSAGNHFCQRSERKRFHISKPWIW